MIVAVLQARASSSRLPGKVLLPVAGKPMLQRQIERVLRARLIDILVVATSTQPEDRQVGAVAQAAGAEVHYGSLNDVLDRFHGAAKPYSPKLVVRLTGDCPLTDPTLLDRVIEAAKDGGYDYTSNAVEPTWPDGLDVEVMTFQALDRCWREAHNLVEREHVTPYIYKHPGLFSIHHVKGEVDLSGLRWTVDEPRDLTFVRAIYDALHPTKPDFTTGDILDLLMKRKDLVSINANIERNEGYRLSLEKLNAHFRGQGSGNSN
jgi:spore coat polysaccharide biosynthesis protein SpsF